MPSSTDARPRDHRAALVQREAAGALAVQLEHHPDVLGKVEPKRPFALGIAARFARALLA